MSVYFLFFGVALLYAMAGFGGGSSYLAILVLYGMSQEELRPLALLCNLVVVTQNTVFYQWRKVIPWSRVWPWLIGSVPMAAWAAGYRWSSGAWQTLLGSALVLAAIALLLQWWWSKKTISGGQDWKGHPWTTLFTGSGLGALAGFTGIGGGIYLSPMLLISHWGTGPQVAATASLFIAANSLAALAGNLSQAMHMLKEPMTWGLLLAVFLGGQAGTRIANRPSLRDRARIVVPVTAVLLLLVARQLLKAWF